MFIILGIQLIRLAWFTYIKRVLPPAPLNLVYDNVVHNNKLHHWNILDGEAKAKVYNNVALQQLGAMVGIRTSAKNSLIANNTIYNTSGPGIWVSNSGTGTFKNNILYLNNLQT